MIHVPLIARMLATAILAMLTAGCFVSARPLLLSADATQPVEAGVWITYGLDTGDKPPRTFDCRTFAGQRFCRSGFEDLRPTRNRSYIIELLRTEPVPTGDEYDSIPEDEPNIHETWFSDIGDSFYLIQQDTNELSPHRFVYGLGLATMLDDGRDALLIYWPTCDKNPELHDLAPPEPSDDDYCSLPSRQNLYRLMHHFKTAVQRGVAPTMLYIKG